MIINYFELSAAFDLEPAQAIEFFQGKGLIPTFSYLDLVGEEHDTAFTVAKMMDTDLLGTVKGKLDDALATGSTLQDFKRDLIPQLQKAGWWGKADQIDPLTGQVVSSQLGSASRLETIFRTNLQSAYAAGHWEKVEANAQDAPYLLYDAVDDAATRPEHAAWDGTLLPIGSPFWDTHYPLNGYNCRCGVIQVDEDELAEYGINPSAEPDPQNQLWTNPRTGKGMMVPKGVDPQFSHNPGKNRAAKINELAAEKAEAMAAEEAQALASAQASLEQAKAAGKMQAQADKALKELQSAKVKGAFATQKAKTQQRAAQYQIDQAIADKTPYLSAAVKQVSGTKAGKAMTPTDLLEAAKQKALKSEQNSLTQSWKQSMIAGKTPNAKAADYVATLPDEIQSALKAEIDAKNGTLLAKEELKAIATGTAETQTKLKQGIFNQWSKNGKAAEYGTPKDLLAAITKEAAGQQLKKETASAMSGLKKKLIEGKLPTDKQAAIYKTLSKAEQDKITADVELAKPKPAPLPEPEPEKKPAIVIKGKPSDEPAAKATPASPAPKSAPEPKTKPVSDNLEAALFDDLPSDKQYKAIWESQSLGTMIKDLGMEDGFVTPDKFGKLSKAKKTKQMSDMLDLMGELEDGNDGQPFTLMAQDYIKKQADKGDPDWMTPKKAPQKPAPPEILETDAPDMDNLIQTGPQEGSNPGGKYKDTTTGQEWYIKTPDSADSALNEALTGKLYQAAGVEVPDLALVTYDGKPGIASKMIDGVNKAPDALKANQVSGVHENMAIDAWLANWDVVGMKYDNLLVKAGRAIRVDTGGGLRYRAQGGMKGSDWGNKVGELESLRDQGLNPQAASVFNSATDDQIRVGVTRLAKITDGQIDDLVKTYGPAALKERNALAKTLKARRDDLVQRFGIIEAKPAPAPLKGVSKGEAERITQARQNGYAVPMDKDAIEDQQILFWNEASASGKKRTHAQLKVREEGLRSMEDVISKSNAGGTVDLKATLDATILEAIPGIRKFGTVDGLRETDIARIKTVSAEFKKARAAIAKAVAGGSMTPDDLDIFDRNYAPWVNYLEKIGKKKEGTVIKWAPSSNKVIGGVFNTGRAQTPAAQAAKFDFKKITGTGFKQKEIRAGRAVETTQDLNSPEYEYYQGTVEGVEVRFWGKGAPQALRGRVELITQGTDAAAGSRALAALERAGINTDRPSALDTEELYLRQIAYHRNDIKTLEAAASKPGQEQRISYLKTTLSKGMDKPIDQRRGYNPQGDRQAFGEGFLHRYRPDLPEKEWAKFQEQSRLFHENTGGMEMPELIDVILNSGGKMAPTTDKMRRGVKIGGESPEPDIESGGAQYFFTRLRNKQSTDPGFYFKAKHVARLDAISYDHDAYGETKGNHVTMNRKTGIEQWKEARGKGDNETILKDGVSLFDDFDRLVATNKAERDAIIAVFKKNGYKQWPDGRKLSEVITLE